MGYAAPDFAIYGLDESWTDRRWLWHYSAAHPGGVREVLLAHAGRPRLAPEDPWTIVSSAPAQVDILDWTGPEPVVHFEAHDFSSLVEVPLMTLFTVTMPSLETGARRRYWHAYRELIPKLGDDRAAWSSASWTLDGEPHRAAIFNFAGVWCGVVLIDGKAAVSVVSTEPDRAMKLVHLESTESYGFDARQTFLWPETMVDSWRSVWGRHRDPAEPSWPPHPDHDRLLA